MAGFFGIGDFTKEGPGVNKNGAKKKRFFAFWEIFWRKKGKLILINVLYLVCCLPLVTIGPATAGLMLVLRNMANEQPTFESSDFFDGFRKNFKQAFPVGLLFTLLFAVDLFGVWFYSQMAAERAEMKTLAMIAMIVLFGVFFILLFMSFYVYLLMVTCNLKFKPLMKNAFILSLVALKTNILTALSLIGLLALFLLPMFLYVSLYPLSVILLVLYGASLPGLAVAFNSYPYITKYVTDPYYEEHADEKKTPTEEAIFEDLTGKDEKN